MFDLILILIPLCPLVACLVTATLGPRFLRERSHWPAILGCAGACVCAWIALASLAFQWIAQSSRLVTLYRFLQVPAHGTVPVFDVSIALHYDSLSAIMLAMLTFVGTLVAIYASGYMHGERGYWRFFAAVSLFVFSMVMLVLSASFLQLFIFWEAVGLCSYLLIGFWYTKPEAASAGQKAFVVNRIGDFGFVIGVFLIWTTFGAVTFAGTIHNAPALAELAQRNPGLLTIICLCLFAGAIGKSAQFPLHVWLPDAMEGPTPVSALIHAATMVTAGVYLVARCTPFFVLAPQAQLVVSIIGGFTAFLAACIALTQTDLKRVLAYSTVSQLGYMFLGLGAGSALGIAGAMFHLVTHAFFKALLFLGAGSVMHAMGGVIDMRQFSGLRRIMPTTYWTFLIGSFALAGLAPLSGFWSKDTILSAVHHASQPHTAEHATVEHPTPGHADEPAAHHEPGAAPPTPAVALPPASLLGISAPRWYGLLYLLGTLTAFMTAFYTFRAVFMTFHGPEKIPHEAGRHAHESPSVMTIPLVILSVGAAFLGLALGHPTGLFDGFLGRTIPGAAEHHAADWTVIIGSTIVAVLGIGLAWVLYGNPSPLPGKIAAAVRPLANLSLHKFYLDEIYALFIVLPLRAVGQLSRFVDWLVIDTLLVGQVMSSWPATLGRLAQYLQTGLVQFYALAMMAATAVLMWALLWQG